MSKSFLATSTRLEEHPFHTLTAPSQYVCQLLRGLEAIHSRWLSVWPRRDGRTPVAVTHAVTNIISSNPTIDRRIKFVVQSASQGTLLTLPLLA